MSPYLRGDGEAGLYLGLVDPQGRTFRKWADEINLPYAVVGTVRTYRRQDIDRAWLRKAANLVNLSPAEVATTSS